MLIGVYEMNIKRKQCNKKKPTLVRNERNILIRIMGAKNLKSKG